MRGEMEAKDRFELARLLRQNGYTMISCKEKDEKTKFSLSFLKFGTVSLADKMIFSRNLGVMISAGLPLTRALDILSRQAKNQRFKKNIIFLMESVQKGNPLSESMKNYPRVFSSLFIAMVKVGEESGQLSESLRLVADQLERDHALTKKVRGALIYPAIIILAMVAIGILMMIYVVPTLVATFEDLNIELPASTKIVIFVSNFLGNHTIFAISGLLLIILMIAWFFRTERGKRLLGNILLHLPIFSPIVKKINSGRTSRTLASLIGSGVNIIDALSITQDVLQNHRYKEVLGNARSDVQKGAPISESFKKASNLYPLLVGEMMAVGEETGKLSEMLNRLAIFYEAEVAEATKDMTTVIEPLLMIIIGLVVGFFAISMLKPMYSMMGTI